MLDPFPNEKSLSIPYKQKDKMDLAYEKSRYLPDQHLSMIYIPRAEMMFKMMRACIGVKEISELWIFDQNSKHLQCDQESGKIEWDWSAYHK